MVKIVNMHEAKTTLSKLVEEAEAGEEILIARAGKPVVRLVPVQTRERRKLGQWAGKVRMSADFDAGLSPDDLEGWEPKR